MRMTAQAGDTLDCKRALRRELRLRRASVSDTGRKRAALRATATLVRTRAWQCARHVALYLACGSELPTTALAEQAWRQGKRIYVPHIGRSTGQMRFVEWRRGAKLRRNRYGILEPVGRLRQRPLQRLDLLLAPLLGFDARGFRLGTGGGYYDRRLARRVGCRPLCLGWALAIQEVPAVPRDPWDHRLDGIVTERGLRWPTG